MGRIPCCEKDSVKRGQWTPEEDAKLVAYIAQHGTRNWRLIPKNSGLQRCGKSCRLRWTNYLRPDLKHGEFTEHEEQTIIKLHSVVGNRWSLIAAQIPGRTDNDVKNHWNTKLKKKLSGMGIDPVTHKPFSHLMAEIASTLGPPQVAHLAEAALGCFKDEMLHLLTNKRIDWQPENSALNYDALTATAAHRHWDLIPPTNNEFGENSERINDRAMEARDDILLPNTVQSQSQIHHSSNDEHPELIVSTRTWDHPQLQHSGEIKDLSGFNGMNNSFPTTGPVQLRYSSLYSGTLRTNMPLLKSSQTHVVEGVQGLWRPSHNTWNEEGSLWTQSVCSDSTCTGGDRQGAPRDKEDEEEEGASDDDGGVKGVGVFNSDCVLWDLADDLINPIL